MANNRLYIVDRDTKEYAMIAKNYGGPWELGNKEMLQQIIENSFDAEGTELILGTENDNEFYDKYILNGININSTGKWEYNW